MTVSITKADLFTIFNTRDGRTVCHMACTEQRARDYATALGGAYDYDRAERGFYVEKRAGGSDRVEYLIACYPHLIDAERRANSENMASDVASFRAVRFT